MRMVGSLENNLGAIRTGFTDGLALALEACLTLAAEPVGLVLDGAVLQVFKVEHIRENWGSSL